MRERRTVADRAADREVARALRARQGAATVADVVVATALPEKTVERALARLLDGHEGSVGVARGGALIYRFALGPLGLRARRERRVVLRAAVLAAATVAGAVIATLRAGFRFVLAVQLLVYLILVLAPVSAALGAVIGVGLFVVLIFTGEGAQLLAEPVVAALVLAGCIVYASYRVLRRKADLLMALVGRDVRGKPGLAGFVARINDFALGPEAPPSPRGRVDAAWTVSQDDERIVLERVRRRGGRLRAGDLCAWLGLDLERADRQATRLCVEYGGEPTAADIDVVEFELPLLETAGDERPARDARTRHERGVELPRLTGGTGVQDAMVVLFAKVNGIAGAVGWFVFSDLAVTGSPWWELAAIAGGLLPAGFSVLLVGLFLVRVPPFLLRRALRRRAAARAAVHDAIVTHARARGEAPLDLDRLGEHARPVAVGLGGTFDLDGDDPRGTVWRFPRLARELSAPGGLAGRLRRVAELPDGA